MFLKPLYRVAKPLITNSKILSKFMFYFGQRFNILPKVLTIASTYKCQCKCIHCGVSDYKKVNEKELSTDEIKNLIDQAKKIHSIVQVTFTGGETMLRKDLVELIRHSKINGFFTKIDTNADLLDEERLARLKEAGLDRAGISLDHFQEEVHDAYRKREGLFRRVIEGVRLCRDFKVSCYIQTYVTRQNLYNGDLDKTLEFSEKLNVEKIKIQGAATLGSFNNKDEVSLKHDDFIFLQEVISKHPSAYVESEVFSPLDYKGFCRMNFKTNIHVTSYGDVVPCCWFPLSFGNIRENSLREVLNQMYRNAEFKKLLTYDGCLCSNQEVLRKYLGDGKNLPANVNNIGN
ncbi:MAG: radical SAM protein [Candidatus Omnitrophica bacterium]|nr:radical SAM protein [Candidatus Omnitrophota bacterium]